MLESLDSLTIREQKNQYQRVWSNHKNPQAAAEIKARWKAKHNERMKTDPIYRAEQQELVRNRVRKHRAKKKAEETSEER